MQDLKQQKNIEEIKEKTPWESAALCGFLPYQYMQQNKKIDTEKLNAREPATAPKPK